jgi:hypothetical protein
MPYQLTIRELPAYVHAKVVGERTPQNMLRFLEEVSAACERSGRSAALLEMQLSGPSLGTIAAMEVLLQRIPDGRKLSKIAYVEKSIDDPAMPYFAETVARNRGVNVRTFPSVEAAAAWLSAPP